MIFITETSATTRARKSNVFRIEEHMKVLYMSESKPEPKTCLSGLRVLSEALYLQNCR